MYVYEIFQKINYDNIFEIIKEKHPVFQCESFLNLPDDRKNIVFINAKQTIINSLNTINNKGCVLDDSIIMVIVKTDIDLSSYLVEKEDVFKNHNNICIWSINENVNCINTFGYNFIPWEEVLGYKLCPKSLELDINEIAAEMFCEMTRFGFEENEIERTSKKFSIDLQGINLNNEINNSRKRKRNDDRWFDKLCDKMHISKAPVEYYDEASEEKIIKKNNHKIHVEYLKTIK